MRHCIVLVRLAVAGKNRYRIRGEFEARLSKLEARFSKVPVTFRSRKAL